MRSIVIAAMAAFACVCLRGAAKKQPSMEATGGTVKRAALGKVVVINAQSLVSNASIKEAADMTVANFRVPVEILADDKFSMPNIEERKKRHGANVAVFVIDDPTLPLTLVAPESAIGIVNIRAAKSADEAVTESRARRLLARTMLLAMGGAYTPGDGTMTAAVTKAEELDALPESGFSGEQMFGVIAHIKKLGFRPERVATYSSACEEGWAPAPTNDVQRAIWDKAHASPTEPIRIKYKKPQ